MMEHLASVSDRISRAALLLCVTLTTAIGCGSDQPSALASTPPTAAGSVATPPPSSGVAGTPGTTPPLAGTTATIPSTPTGTPATGMTTPAPSAGSVAPPVAGAAGAAGAAGVTPPATDPSATATPYHDPGKGPWEVVPEADVPAVCKLDVAKLKQSATSVTYPWLIVRYGKVCWQSRAMNFAPTEAYSTTKTLGALVTGMVSYQTRMLMRTGKKTGQLSDEDRADQWLDSQSYNKEAKVAHVLGMVAHDSSLAYGMKSFAYDTVGATEINSLGTMINNALKQDTARLGTSVADFTEKFLYAPLGMTKSSWAGTVFAYTWTVDLLDMARVGVLINNYGVWSGERLADEQWIYRQTHPSFEDSNTGFGYLTWLNSRSNWESISGGKQQMPGTPGTCAPVAIHKTYPHGVSEAKDCGYTAPATCDQKYDVGVWNAEGLGGQLIQGHRGLDLVIVARDAQPGGTGPGTAKQVWEALNPAVIAGDPMFKGDKDAFCKAYGANDYAPDLK